MERYRYLVVDIDKHQDDPSFCNELGEFDMTNADDYLTMIIDLETGKRYFGGSWRDIHVRKSNPTQDAE